MLKCSFHLGEKKVSNILLSTILATPRIVLGNVNNNRASSLAGLGSINNSRVKYQEHIQEH